MLNFPDELPLQH